MDGRAHHEAAAFGCACGGIHNIADCVLFYFLTGYGAVSPADAGPEQFEVIVDLGNGTHRGTAASGRHPLLDRNGGGEVVDPIHIGLLHSPRKLTDIGAQALDIPPLTLGIQRIEGEGTLAGSAQAGHNGHLSEGQVHIHVLEVVYPGAPNADGGRQGSECFLLCTFRLRGGNRVRSRGGLAHGANFVQRTLRGVNTLWGHPVRHRRKMSVS